MNISERFVEHFFNTLNAQLPNDHRPTFPHKLPIQQSTIPYCLNQYVDNQIVAYYRTYIFQTPIIDPNIQQEIVNLLDEYVLDPQFFQDHIIGYDTEHNAQMVEDCVNEFRYTFNSEGSFELIEHFKNCLLDFKGYTFSKYFITLHADYPALYKQYRRFLKAMEYDCLCEILEPVQGSIPSYSAHQFRQYMFDIVRQAHLNLNYPFKDK